MEVGKTELITMPMISEQQRAARRRTMTKGISGLTPIRREGCTYAAHA